MCSLLLSVSWGGHLLVGISCSGNVHIHSHDNLEIIMLVHLENYSSNWWVIYGPVLMKFLSQALVMDTLIG
jgi:hypothetical protein